MGQVKLAAFTNTWYAPGRSVLVRTLWFVVNAIFLQCPLNPSSIVKVWLLRIFGAKIGVGVRIKPSINVKHPWNLQIGDYSWIGEKAWLDSLAPIKIGNNVCISQGAYLCTGNHDWTDPAFGLIVKPIIIEDGVWLGAKATVLPGVTISSHSVVVAGTIIAKDTEAYGVYSGNPAVKVRERAISSL
jgi:putative colanic acid biosynthesis acetyltransferase WcaF